MAIIHLRNSWKQPGFYRVLPVFCPVLCFFTNNLYITCSFCKKKSVHLTFSSQRSGDCKVPSRIGGHHFLQCQQTKKHRKNCECCPVSQLIVRMSGNKDCHEFRFSIVSVANVTSLQDCLFNCQNGKSNFLNCQNCCQLSKIDKIIKKC